MIVKTVGFPGRSIFLILLDSKSYCASSFGLEQAANRAALVAFIEFIVQFFSFRSVLTRVLGFPFIFFVAVTSSIRDRTTVPNLLFWNKGFLIWDLEENADDRSVSPVMPESSTDVSVTLFFLLCGVTGSESLDLLEP